MSLFLRMKHWQLFALLFALPVMFNVGATVVTVSHHNNGIIAIAVPVTIVYTVAMLYAWLYAMGSALYKRRSEGVHVNINLFRAFLIIPLAFIAAVCCVRSGTIDSSLMSFFTVLAVFILFMFSTFCVFYCFYFVAKLLKSAELQREATFSDAAGDFFLLWFYPIGIWLVQPRINRMFQK